MFDTNVPLYGFAILLSLIVNIFVVFKLSKKYNYNKNEIVALLLYENVGIIGGAKIFTFIQNYDKLNGQFDFLSLGLSSYGAVIGAMLFLLLFCIQFKKSIKELLYIFIPSIPLMYGIGKIGCFLVGCCYGIEYNGFLNVIYKYSKSAPKNIPLFPIQIVETIVFISIFIYMMVQHKKDKFDLKVVGISFILSGLFKFLLEFLRHSHIGKIISSTQMISIVFIIIGIFIIIYNKRLTKEE